MYAFAPKVYLNTFLRLTYFIMTAVSVKKSVELQSLRKNSL